MNNPAMDRAIDEMVSLFANNCATLINNGQCKKKKSCKHCYAEAIYNTYHRAYDKEED